MIYRLILILLFTNTLTFTQSQSALNIHDAVRGTIEKFKVEKLSGFNWINDHTISYNSKNTLFIFDILNNKQERITDLKEINEILKTDSISEISSIRAVTLVDKENVKFRIKNKHYHLNLADKKLEVETHINRKAKNIEFAPNKKSWAYTVKNNLFVGTSKLDKRITHFKDKNFVAGQVVSRNEFGIHKGTFWSPNSELLAFYVKDESEVSEYPIVDFTKSPIKLNTIKYPRVGEKSEKIKVGIYDTETGENIYIDDQSNEPDCYYTNLTWSPDNKFLYIQVLSRNQKKLKLNKYSATTGKLIQTLFTEENDKWVEPENPIVFLNNSKTKFIYQSEKDGFNHLYLYNLEEGRTLKLTKGNWIVTQLIDISEDNKFVFYMGTEHSPLERNLYKLNLETFQSERLTKLPGTHKIAISKDFNFFIDQYSNVNTPSITNISKIDNGAVVAQLEISKNPYRDLNFPKMQIGSILGPDNKTELKLRVILPPNFNENKKYPAIVYVYGGPHVQLIKNKWLGGARLWQYYMAQNGYIMFSIDNRGSANRGFEFESAVHGQLGQKEMEDQLQGIKYLKTLKYVNQERIGVFGWSFGGFMTTSLLLNHPDVFKVGVAGGPVTNWKFYETMYGERYMDSPQTNPEGYKLTNTLVKAANLKAKFMLIHGSLDPVVVQEHSAKLLREFVKTQKEVDYMIYPAHKHNVRGEDRVHLMNKISKYFFDYL